jgi:hypothetical protein
MSAVEPELVTPPLRLDPKFHAPQRDDEGTLASSDTVRDTRGAAPAAAAAAAADAEPDPALIFQRIPTEPDTRSPPPPPTRVPSMVARTELTSRSSGSWNTWGVMQHREKQKGWKDMLKL